MRILIASASGFYDERYPETRKNNSGFGHMIKALAEMLPMEGDEVDILTQSNFTKGRQIGKSRLYKKTGWKLLCHAKWHYLTSCFRMLRRSHLPLGMRARTILYYLTGAYCEDVIKKNRYDVVHVNGITMAAMPLIDACVRTNTPFVITLHGLISFDDSVNPGAFAKKFEKKLIELLKSTPVFQVTVISSGIKRRMCEYAGVEDLPNITVINNPFISETESEKEANGGFNALF